MVLDGKVKGLLNVEGRHWRVGESKQVTPTQRNAIQPAISHLPSPIPHSLYAITSTPGPVKGRHLGLIVGVCCLLFPK
jgi:hypothetical protein